MLEMSKNQKISLVNACPKKVFEIDPNSDLIEVKRPEDCIFCGDCENL